MPKFPRRGIKNWGRSRILRYTVDTRIHIARDAKRSLRPAQKIGPWPAATPKKQIDLFSCAKYWHAVHVRLHVVNATTRKGNMQNSRCCSFPDLEDFKLRICPDLSISPNADGADTSRARYRRRLIRQIIEAQPHKCRRARCCRQNGQPDEEQCPQQFSPQSIAHFIAPPALRSPQSHLNWRSG